LRFLLAMPALLLRRSKLRPASRLFSSSRFDAVICGGGVMGSSSAYHLAARAPGMRIAVIERDNAYKHASAMLSAGGIRQQFSLRENVLMSLYGADMLRDPSGLAVDEEVPDLQFIERGYLFLAPEQADGQPESILRSNHAVQQEAGATGVRLLNREELRAQFPWMHLDDIALGAFGAKDEGSFDPWAMLQAMKRKALSLGNVTYINGEVRGLTGANGKLTGVTYAPCSRSGPGDTLETLECGTVVNAAGAFGAGVVEMAGAALGRPVAPLPVAPRKRSIFIMHVPDGVPEGAPLIVDPCGVYVRPEGKGARFLCGVSPPADQDPDCRDNDDLDVVQCDLFDEVVWPALYERCEAFGNGKQVACWAGFYDYNTVDQNGIIGPHPDVPNLILCNGFSGHGLQQAPAAGRAVAELVADGQFQAIDLHRFRFERFADGELALERNIV